MAAELAGLYLGIVGSIGAIVTMSNTTYNYIRTTIGANDEKKTLLLEIAATTALLEELERRLQATPEWKNTFKAMKERDGPLEMYRSALEKVDAKLEHSKNRFVRVTGRFVWYFHKDEFTEILATIGRSKTDFHTILQL